MGRYKFQVEIQNKGLLSKHIRSYLASVSYFLVISPANKAKGLLLAFYSLGSSLFCPNSLWLSCDVSLRMTNLEIHLAKMKPGFYSQTITMTFLQVVKKVLLLACHSDLHPKPEPTWAPSSASHLSTLCIAILGHHHNTVRRIEHKAGYSCFSN